MESSSQLHVIIKLRHLKKASQNNWEMLANTKKMVGSFITEARQLMSNYGKSEGKEQFEIDANSLSVKINGVQESLNDFYQFILNNESIDIESSFQKFSQDLEDTENLFKTISSYPSTYFLNMDVSEWKEIWTVIKSNLTIIQGLGESAYLKSLMIKNFSNSEADALTEEIVKHIPQSFNLLEADKYKQEYMQAVEEIEQESNAKLNLWDRFLSVLAGVVPLKQTPEERVMMRRWLDGEKGELE